MAYIFSLSIVLFLCFLPFYITHYYYKVYFSIKSNGGSVEFCIILKCTLFYENSGFSFHDDYSSLFGPIRPEILLPFSFGYFFFSPSAGKQLERCFISVVYINLFLRHESYKGMEGKTKGFFGKKEND